MEKSDIEESLRSAANGSAFIGCAKLRKWLGVGQNAFREFVRNIEYRVSGNRKVYFIGDIADRIIEEGEYEKG